MNKVHILGFSGSLRQGSYNRALLRAAQELLPEDVRLELFDLGPIPLYNGDVEARGFPEAVVAFKERIAAADALLIAAPEYNYSMPGVLKNAIDWASRPPDASPLNGKPVALMGASVGLLGTARSQYHLRQVCVFTNMLPLNRPEVFVGRAHEKFDAQGRLIDENTRKHVKGLLEAVRDWTRRLRCE
ncbi:MAG: NAD(P)H-dependent oxidoreductase [Phycisphaerae bacterium]|jgi:chromate reductase|nr:NAD(P)H-dependent oxidoreductase [Phycisphaerae bacterium]HOO16216.1 NADPH-dependent FMN reductase [Phycisphaerae bacterium]HPC21642.1 NADPH-dependent FMN reductase [Phycisphaerae bacterium]HRS26821.1 NADPH-dependent FMN reductase [Phycisphaerae bacterium]